ncbi:uncharacterized protein C1orf167 homolog [Meriones unguiculatus]|uniref:uncharacterized protein C1orf167 homolog n=1 Tax=Meriones unguiculatus TaxID=10047 RepID=UPI00293F4C9F|nr:uncharacterized protein C1orf167 homolog [Meriones unguiculatus]
MEPRPATRYKENVPPKPVAVLRPELKRPWRNLDSSLDSSLGSGRDRRMLMCQATTPSQGSVLCQKPYQVQSNLASPQPRLALALKDRAGRVGDTGLLQQSNLQLPAGRSRRRTREPFVQHSNLCFRGTPSPRLQNSCLPPTGPSSHRKQTLQVTDTSCLDLRLSGDLAHLDGCIYTDPRPWGSSGSWVPRLVGKPLTLKDLSIPAHSQFQAPPPSSCSTVHWLLDSIQHLEPEATRSGSQASQEYPSPKQRGAHTRDSQSTPAQPWSSHPRQNKAQSIVTPDPQATWDLTELASASNSRTLAGLQGGRTVFTLSLMEYQEPPGPKNHGPMSYAPGRKLLSKSFRAWRHLSQRRQAVAKATALSHRQMIRERLRGLRWILWLREAQLEAAWGQHAKALLAWSFQEWRCVALQQKQKQPHIQAAPMFLASRRSPSLGGKAATDLAWRCRCFRAWQRFMQRGARYRRQLAHQRARTLRTCLGQWMEMKQLQASDVAKVTQLALCRQKAGKEVLSSLAPRTAMACCLATVAQAQPLPRGPDWCSLWEACRKLGLHRVLLLWRMRLYQHQQAISFFQGTRKRALRDILSQWHLRVWGLDPLPSSMKTTLALEPWGSSPGGEAQLGCRTGGSLEKVRVQQTPGAARLYWRSLQRRVLLSWSHWTAAQGAWREQAAHWAWALHCRAVMGLWRQRLAQCQAVQKRVQERGRGLVRTALSRWLSCWQRQQFLCEQYQKWGQVHLQVLQKALFEGWQQAAARRRCLRSYFQAWRECVRGTRMFQDRHQAFPDGLRGDLGSVIANSHEVCRAETLARDRPEASVLAWRSFPQQSGAVRQLRRAQAQQAFVVLRVTLGLCREARQQAGRRAQVLTPVQEVLCWILWTHGAYIGQAHQAHAAQQLTAQ